MTAPGGGSGLTVFTGTEDNNGNPLMTVVKGLSIQAIAAETVTPVVVSGTGGGAVGVAGSAVLNLLTEQTQAHIDDGATVNASTAGANPNQTVNLLAWDVTAISSWAGGTSSSNIAGIGGGADIGVINKQTEAFIANSASTPATPAHVSAVGNVILQALSQEGILSISGTAAAGLAAAIAGAASVYTVNDTTEAYVGASTTVEAGGNVLIAANDFTGMNLTAGPSSPNLSLGVSIGAAGGVAILNKTTSAFIGSGATVDASANAPAITVDNGTFNVTNVAPSGQDGQVTAPPVTNSTLVSLLSDLDLTTIRIATPATTTMQGVAVTATNEDNIASAAASFGAALVAPIQIAGAVSIVNNTTSAYIGSSAKVNQNTPSAAAAQTVLVTAGDDYHFLGVGGAATGGLLTAIGTGGDLVLGKNQTTQASIGTSAEVSAAQDVIVTAGAAEDILLVAAEVTASLTANIAGAVATVSLNDKTYAFIDANAVVNAGGSVLVYAHDDTTSEIISGAATLGIAAGVGAGMGVTDLSKDTAAYIGTSATVNASGIAGNGFAGFSGVVNPSSFATMTIRGVAVQAESSENVHTFAASGAAGYTAQVAGAIAVDIFEADTEAYIAAGAQVNQSQNASKVNAGQTVDVAAADYLNVTSLGGSLVSGLASLAGAADLGLVRNSTTAWLGIGAAVNALQDVDVYALTIWNVSSSAISAAGGTIGIAGSVAIYAVGATLGSDAKNYLAATSSSGGSPGFPNVNSFVDSEVTAVATAIGNLLSNLSGGPGSTQSIAAGTTLNNDAPGSEVTNAVSNGNVPGGTTAFIGGATVTAVNNVNVDAREVLNLTVFPGVGAVGSGSVGASISIVEEEAVPQAYLTSGTVVTAGQDFDMEGDAANTELDNAPVPAIGVGALGVAGLADAKAGSASSSQMQAGSTVTANTATVAAINNNSFDTEAWAIAAQSSGPAGIGATLVITDYVSSAVATVSGKLTTAGNANINAESNNNLARNASSASALGQKGGTVGSISNSVGSFFSDNISSSVGSGISSFGSGLSSTLGSSSPTLAFAAAVALATSQNVAQASVGNNAHVAVAGNLTVYAFANDNFQVAASGSASDASFASIGGGVADFELHQPGERLDRPGRRGARDRHAGRQCQRPGAQSGQH